MYLCPCVCLFRQVGGYWSWCNINHSTSHLLLPTTKHSLIPYHLAFEYWLIDWNRSFMARLRSSSLIMFNYYWISYSWERIYLSLILVCLFICSFDPISIIPIDLNQSWYSSMYRWWQPLSANKSTNLTFGPLAHCSYQLLPLWLSLIGDFWFDFGSHYLVIFGKSYFRFFCYCCVYLSYLIFISYFT